MITIFGVSIDDFFKKKEQKETEEPNFSVINQALNADNNEFPEELSDKLLDAFEDFTYFVEDMDAYYYSEELLEAIENQFDAIVSGLNALRKFIDENRKEIEE